MSRNTALSAIVNMKKRHNLRDKIDMSRIQRMWDNVVSETDALYNIKTKIADWQSQKEAIELPAKVLVTAAVGLATAGNIPAMAATWGGLETAFEATTASGTKSAIAPYVTKQSPKQMEAYMGVSSKEQASIGRGIKEGMTFYQMANLGSSLADKFWYKGAVEKAGEDTITGESIKEAQSYTVSTAASEKGSEDVLKEALAEAAERGIDVADTESALLESGLFQKSSSGALEAVPGAEFTSTTELQLGELSVDQIIEGTDYSWMTPKLLKKMGIDLKKSDKLIKEAGLSPSWQKINPFQHGEYKTLEQLAAELKKKSESMIKHIGKDPAQVLGSVR